MNPAAVMADQDARYRVALFYLDLIHRGVTFTPCGLNLIQVGPLDLLAEEEWAALPTLKPAFLAILSIESSHAHERS